MENLPTRKTAERRREKLMLLQQQRRRNEAKVGTVQDAIITGVCSETEHLLEGRLASQAPEIDGRLLINDGHELIPSFPSFARIEITEAHSYDLVGRIVQAA